MGLSKSTRITIMLVIDIVFFATELGVGLYVSSLALLADAFHMLNDIISLVVGLWAVKVAQKASSDRYTYGWLRAEILGAFFNAVFLIALCVSVVLEAATRLIDPPEISNPKLILIVGSWGLLSNIVGFFVLGGHSHGHSHGHGHDHDHDHGADLSSAEQGYGSLSADDENDVAIHVYPELVIAKSQTPLPRPQHQDSTDHTDSPGRSRRSTSRTAQHRARFHSFDGHPNQFRHELISASKNKLVTSSGASSDGSAIDDGDQIQTQEQEALLADAEGAATAPSQPHSHPHGHVHGGHEPQRGNMSLEEQRIHASHHHKKPRKPKQSGHHGHNHSDMGMNAMILHVIGDMLGNVGVIATALVIWLTEWRFKFYADPAVSLFITIIILRSAIPLTFASARILLQATPEHIDVADIREDIESLPGVVSCHHVHIWQLSDTQLVASMHIRLEARNAEADWAEYMKLSRRIRKCLHEHGIHSATIQPEFEDQYGAEARLMAAALGKSDRRAAAVPSSDDDCLLECVENCAAAGCCRSTAPSITGSDHGQGHSHHHNHQHHHHHNH